MIKPNKIMLIDKFQFVGHMKKKKYEGTKVDGKNPNSIEFLCDVYNMATILFFQRERRKNNMKIITLIDKMK